MPVTQVWEFLIQPRHLVQVSPPELNLQLADGPELLHQGTRLTVVGRRWGVSQRIVSEVTTFEPPSLLVDEQRDGPFRQWIHTHRLEAVPEGTRMIDQIDFEPPGGLLGFVVTAHRIEEDLKWVFAYREEQFRKLLEGEPSAG
jgi:ligand-binding SRPBCC domain-containing protein